MIFLSLLDFIMNMKVYFHLFQICIVLIALLIPYRTLQSAPVSLTGAVSNQNQAPVPNAVVTLAVAGISDTTDAGGGFDLNGTVGTAAQPFYGRFQAPGISNGLVHFSLEKAGYVAVNVVDAAGRRIHSTAASCFEAGRHSIDIGYPYSAGLYIIELHIGEADYLFKTLILERYGSSTTTGKYSAPPVMGKEAADPVDTLKVSAARYYPAALGVESYVQSGISILLTSSIDTGINADLHGNRPFPDDNPWNTPVDLDPVDPNSGTLIASIGSSTSLHPDFGADWDGGPFGIPYMVVTGSTPKVTVSFDYADESDPGPYPIVPNAPIEGGPDATGDRHILVIDRDNWILYELFSAYPSQNGWTAGSGAIFNLSTNDLRPAGWTSADAAGLPIFPGLVRYDEAVGQKEINHALRFTVTNSRRAYVYPATHFASSDTSPSRPPMGMRVRLKADFDMSGYPETARVILTALKRYGMIVADNGGDWFLSGAPDSRWNDDEINSLKQVTGGDFEVVEMGTIVTD